MRLILEVLIIFGTCASKILANIPGCDYFDTVDLSNTKAFDNGSYLYSNILIPDEKVAMFDYIKTLEGQQEVPDYPRGCICQEKLCLHLCCTTHEFFGDDVLSITLRNGQKLVVNVLKDVVVLPAFNIPCDQFEEQENAATIWSLFENGLVHSRNQNYHKRDYCLRPIKLANNSSNLVPYILNSSSELTVTKITLLDALRFISIFCLLLTIATYLYLPQLRSVYSKCCLCYFICLTTSFSLLYTNPLIRTSVAIKWCYLIGYIGYFAVIAMFLWLIMMNLTFWKTFGNIGVRHRSSFMKYNFYVWSLAAGSLLITVLADFYIQKDAWKPGVTKYTCWVRVNEWSAMMYYYGPISVALLINLVLTTLTAWKIYKDNRNNRRVFNNTSENLKNLKNQANFSVFFRIFAVTGLVWLLDFFGHICDKTSTQVSWYMNLVTSTQGVVLFWVTILKYDVLKALSDRLAPKKKKSNDNNFSCTYSSALN